MHVHRVQGLGCVHHWKPLCCLSQKNPNAGIISFPLGYCVLPAESKLKHMGLGKSVISCPRMPCEQLDCNLVVGVGLQPKEMDISIVSHSGKNPFLKEP